MRLTKREKKFAAFLAIFAAAWLLFSSVINPARDRIATLERVIPQKQDELRKLSAAAAQYNSLTADLKKLRQSIDAQPENFELLPFLESIIKQTGLDKNLAKMEQRPIPLGTEYAQTVVEVELHALALADIVNFIRKVESSEYLIRTRTIYMKKSRTNGSLLDSVIEIHNPKLTQTAVAMK
ncbi:MAG: type II secretion system protein M [Sedimentisphaerales bacterium]|nr:type II secretion system protein M [Sedimentisphaerales bacterium]